jgi:hypothetical protein
MSRRPQGRLRKFVEPDTGPRHVLSPDLAAQFAQEAWRSTFYMCMRSTPHHDNDPGGDSHRHAQREHLQWMCAAFVLRVAQHAAGAGLFESVQAFQSYNLDAGGDSDPATAGVAVEGGTP